MPRTLPTTAPSWKTTLVTALRVLIGDMDSVAYTDHRLRDILMVAATYVNGVRHLNRQQKNASSYFGVASPFVYSDPLTAETGSTNVYVINIDSIEPSITPDPTLAATLDEEFSNLTITMAANLLANSEVRQGALTAHLEAQVGAGYLKVGDYAEVTEQARRPIPSYYGYIADGSLADGHSMLTGPNSGQRDWEWLFNSLDATVDGWAWNKTPRQLANEQGGTHLHNPGCLYSPMDLEQFIKTTALAVANPTDVLVASADYELFTEAASRYKRDSNLWLGMYVGFMEKTMPVLADETIDEYADRVLLYIAPILNIRPKIDWLGFDHLLGVQKYSGGPYIYSTETEKPVTIGGVDGAEAIVVRRVQEMGIEVISEPTYFISATWLHTTSMILTDNFHNLRESRDPPWSVNNSRGIKEELIHPTSILSSGKTVLIVDRTSWNFSDEEKHAVAADWHLSGYKVNTPFSKFPGVDLG